MAHRRSGELDASGGSAWAQNIPRSPTCSACSARGKSATARPWAAISSRLRPSATARRCCWRWMRSVVIASLTGERTLPLHEFFVAYRKTALQPGEVLKSDPRARGAFRKPGCTRKFEWYKVSKRREMDISTVAACFVVDLDAAGIVRHARLGLWRRRGDAFARAQNRAGVAGQKMECGSDRGVCCRFCAPNSRPSPTCAARRSIAQGLITSLLEKFYGLPKRPSPEQPLTRITIRRHIVRSDRRRLGIRNRQSSRSNANRQCRTKAPTNTSPARRFTPMTKPRRAECWKSGRFVRPMRAQRF